jgi:hypothetical protein
MGFASLNPSYDLWPICRLTSRRFPLRPAAGCAFRESAARLSRRLHYYVVLRASTLALALAG